MTRAFPAMASPSTRVTARRSILRRCARSAPRRFIAARSRRYSTPRSSPWRSATYNRRSLGLKSKPTTAARAARRGRTGAAASTASSEDLKNLANSRYDLVVIGSGPGGYVAAIRASQLKMRVAVIERDLPGGVCLNWGCIPSKALLNSAETIESIRGAGKEHGIEVGEIKLDFKRVIARSREAADKLSKGVRFLLRKNKIDYIEANAIITGPHTVALRPAAGKPPPPAEAIEAERIMIATGSGEKLFPGMALGDGVMTSREALIYDRLPQSIVIIGAGAIGAEFGYFYQAFGAKVTIVELEPQMLPGFDSDIAEELRRSFVKRGVAVLTGHGFKSMARKDGGWSVVLDASGTPKTVDAEAVLVAVGRNPLSLDLGLDTIGVEADRGYIKIDDSFRTACPSVYAIGDVARPP